MISIDIMDRLPFSTDKLKQSAPCALKIAGALFSLIGIAASIRWATSSSHIPQLNDVPNSGCSSSSTDGCPWQHVISDLANRLQLLEMAFKEQVVARETIVKEVSNQSDVNSSLEKKLTLFLQRLSQLDSHIHRLETRLEELTNRLHSDGRQSLGFLVIVMIIVEVMLRLHPEVQKLNPFEDFQRWDKLHSESRKETSSVSKVNFSPKHGGLSLKNELCVVLFKRENNNIVATLIETILKQLDDVKLSVKPHYMIGSEHLKSIPRVKAVSGVSEMEDKGLKIILIMANDEGSKKLTAHNMYNTSLRLVQSHEVLQELASTGRVFSIWRELTSHQLSHLRKIMRSVLNIKTSIR
ncbi:LOW QUALITY PROTEIN: uncharacterized protein LOC124265956 [Haliotis rubra]|uniref:LOW QUALITY PROTEIN: uncharacterized protein LOC124265956 n=1 Tax=Haliotis rubra TaxID=36100 RepID=UPI001EE57432|nr:LOW QUALITY PROTEIN: uncharacterized protein LOC124265956 [Haliotis rubra]